MIAEVTLEASSVESVARPTHLFNDTLLYRATPVGRLVLRLGGCGSCRQVNFTNNVTAVLDEREYIFRG